MRAAFLSELAALAETDDRIVLLTADLGFTVVEPFAERFPNRFYNVGVAETNMLTLATGLASEGMIPFCYSIAAFLSMRCYEAFRDGPVVHNLPVRMVAVGSGVGYGVSGITHYAVEDVALMRSSGQVAIYAPPTSESCADILRRTYGDGGPVYYRLAKDSISDPRLPAEELAANGYVRSGSDGICLLGYGRMATTLMDVADDLRAQANLATQCVVLSRLDAEVLTEALGACAPMAHIFTVEDHAPSGGIGTLAAEYLAGQPSATLLHRLGLGADVWSGFVGSEVWMLKRSGLDREQLANTVLQTVNRRPVACL